MNTSLFWGVIGVGSLSGLILSKSIVQKQIPMDSASKGSAKRKSGNGSKQTKQQIKSSSEKAKKMAEMVKRSVEGQSRKQII